MHYVYILRSECDGNFYVGCTSDLKRRLKVHHSGRVPSTCMRRPLRLVYYEVCLDQRDAAHRERYLKSTYGKRYIKNRIKRYLESDE